MNALEYFKTHLKYEKNPKIKEAITQKFTEYLHRAEEIRAMLEEGGSGAALNGELAMVMKPKSMGKGGEGDGNEDLEKEKMTAGLNSAIIKEKPNVKWNDVAGLESAKQALQETVILPIKYPQFYCIPSSDLVSKWMGESKKLVSNLFLMACESAPSIIFVDEIESLCGQREGNGSEASRRMKTELLVQMSGILR